MNIIYPDNIKKYAGAITQLKSGRYQYRHQTHKVAHTVDTLEEAQDFLMRYAIDNNLMKNLTYDMGNHYEVELTQGKRAKFDKDDFITVDDHTFLLLSTLTPLMPLVLFALIC